MDNILTSIKKLLNVNELETHFDNDIIMHINSALFELVQLGVGNAGVVISKDSKWEDFLGETKELEAVKSFVYLKVKLVFDPPQNSFSIDAIERQIKELSWRLSITYKEPEVPASV